MWFFNIVLSMAKSLDGDDRFSFDTIFLYYSETVVLGNCVFVLGEKHEFVTIELSS